MTAQNETGKEDLLQTILNELSSIEITSDEDIHIKGDAKDKITSSKSIFVSNDVDPRGTLDAGIDAEIGGMVDGGTVKAGRDIKVGTNEDRILDGGGDIYGGHLTAGRDIHATQIRGGGSTKAGRNIKIHTVSNGVVTAKGKADVACVTGSKISAKQINLSWARDLHTPGAENKKTTLVCEKLNCKDSLRQVRVAIADQTALQAKKSKKKPSGVFHVYSAYDKINPNELEGQESVTVDVNSPESIKKSKLPKEFIAQIKEFQNLRAA